MLIDIHAHTNWLGLDTDAWAAHFRSLGVDKVWLLSCHGTSVFRHEMEGDFSTEAALCEAARYPDLFIPFCSFLPWEEDVVDKIEDAVERGCRGFGEHKIRLCIDNPDCIKVFDACGALGLPVLFHIDIPLPDSDMWYNVDASRLPWVLDRCSRTVFVGHGPGFWREISGDADESPSAYPSGPVTSGGRLLSLLGGFENLYCDLSAGSGLNAIRRDPEFGRQFLIDHGDRCMYGTDFNDSSLLDHLRSLELPARVWGRIAHRNAAKLVPLAG